MSWLLSICDRTVTYHNQFNKELEIVEMALCPRSLRQVESQAKSAINERTCAPDRCFLRPLLELGSSRLFQAQAGIPNNHDRADNELSWILLAESAQRSRARVPTLAHQPSGHCSHERATHHLEGSGDIFPTLNFILVFSQKIPLFGPSGQ